RNYEAGRWPAGDPPLYGDIDAHMLHYPSPTKEFMLANRENKELKEQFALAFEKRPEEELYDLRKDPYQMRNIARDEDYREEKKNLAERLNSYLLQTADPRMVGGEMKWINAEYFNENDKKPTPSKKSQEEFGLRDRYNYLD